MKIKSIDGTWHIWIEMKDFAYWRDARYQSCGVGKFPRRHFAKMAPGLVAVWKKQESYP